MYACHIAGEVVSIPLPYAISSIWPLPFGLLLQKSTDGGRMVSSSSSLLNARDLNRPNKEYGLTYNVSCQSNTMETDSKANGAIISSHLILKHPLEEPQVYVVQYHLCFCLVVMACHFPTCSLGQRSMD
jgi:anaphase-promoting complex subunit 1